MVMVTSRDEILALTKVAFLDALIMTLISVQSVAAPIMPLMLVIVPTIFAIQFYYVPGGLVLLSGLGIIILSFAIFGIANAVWMLAYLLIGLIIGLTRKHGWPKFLRIAASLAAFSVAIITIIFLFGWLVQVDMQAISTYVAQLPGLSTKAVIPAFFSGLMIWGMVNAIGCEQFLSGILRQLQYEEGVHDRAV